MSNPLPDAGTRLVLPSVRPHACRLCGIALAGPQHHTLCRPCWHWNQHAKATAQAARYFREEARP